MARSSRLFPGIPSRGDSAPAGRTPAAGRPAGSRWRPWAEGAVALLFLLVFAVFAQSLLDA
ncbi:MAG TPA: hypothetical protein PLG14_10595, partial [Spirochaetales bacterium]|nr:hypothetical protein [Spirochaetales bacterium]